MPNTRCPVDPLEKAWIEYRLQWLSHVFGRAAFEQAAVVGDRDLGLGKAPALDDLPRVFQAIQTLVFPAAKPLSLVLGPPHRQADTYQDGTAIFLTDDHGQSAEQILAGLLVELCRRKLVESGSIGQDARSELLAELSTVFFGIAKHPANHCMGKTWTTGASMEIIPLPYKERHLTSRMFGYAIAVWMSARGDDGTTWLRDLRPDVREAAQKGLDYLRRTPDSFFSSDSIGTNPDALSNDDVLELIGSDSQSKCIIGLWQLANLHRLGTREFEAVVALLDHSVPEIRSSAAEALSLAESASPGMVEALSRALTDRHNQVRASAARTLGYLRPQDQRVVDQMHRLLNDADREVALGAGWALGQFGNIAQAAIPSLIRILRRALVECEHQSIETIVGSLDSIAPEFECLIPDIVEADEPDLRSLVHEALVKHRQVD